MSVKTWIQERRYQLAKQHEIANAEAAVNVTTLRAHSRAMVPMFALAFVFMLAALAGPASAAMIDLNQTVGPILDGVSALVPSIINLIVAVVPAIIVLAVVGFIVKFLDRILQLLSF